MAAYPYGGFTQYLTAPASALVKLPDRMSFEEAARLGYLGTAYSAMKKIRVGPGETLLINGISGTLGLCAAVLALAMGASKILETPGSITFAHEVFTLMHYGLSNDLAAHCLLLLAAISLGTLLWRVASLRTHLEG